MPMSRCLKNDMRKAIKPASGTSNPGQGNGDAGGGSVKQYTSGKVKNSAPKYPQSDPATAKYGKSGMK